MLCIFFLLCFLFFFFNATATTEIYTLSLHDALPILGTALAAARRFGFETVGCSSTGNLANAVAAQAAQQRSEEHTSELQSRVDLVCRLLLEKKKKNKINKHKERQQTSCEKGSISRTR